MKVSTPINGSVNLNLNEFKLFFSKITQYSPADNNKAYERQVNRRANVQFDPRATLEILRLGDPPGVLTDVHKRDLVKKYLQVVDF
jgi:hypothetical protein